MKIVIDIDEEIYKCFIDDWLGSPKILRAVRKGTPLPKNHGDLIDRNEIIKDVAIVDSLVLGKFRVVSMIESQQTVIEGSDSE